jgi:hypothetical protein
MQLHPCVEPIIARQIHGSHVIVRISRFRMPVFTVSTTMASK